MIGVDNLAFFLSGRTSEIWHHPKSPRSFLKVAASVGNVQNGQWTGETEYSVVSTFGNLILWQLDPCWAKKAILLAFGHM